MVLSNRNHRQASSRRMVNVALALTIIVLLVYVAVNSKSKGLNNSVAAKEWVQKVNGLVAQSNAQGQAFSTFRSVSAQGTTEAKVTASLDSLRSGSQELASKIASIKAPQSLAVPAGLLQACLQTRAKAASAAVGAIQSELNATSGTSAGAATSTVMAAVQQLQVADQAYSLFSQDLPGSLGWRPPASQWITSTDQYQQAGLDTWLGSLASQFSTTPTSKVSIVAITTQPQPIKNLGRVEVIPDSPSLAPSVVVGNVGNTALNGITVTVGISNVTKSGTGNATAHLGTLASGAFQTIDFPALNPPTGVVFDLVVTVTPASGSQAAPVQKTIQFEMPLTGKGASSTTSTSSTTVKHHSGKKK